MTNDVIDQCIFFDCIDIDGKSFYGKCWDLRGRLTDLLAGVDICNASYLDANPLSGFFSFTAEQEGAVVTSIVSDPGASNFTWLDSPFIKAHCLNDIYETKRRLNNAYFYCQKKLGSKCCTVKTLADLEKKSNSAFDYVVIARLLAYEASPADYLLNMSKFCLKYMIIIIDEYILEDRALIELCQASNGRIWVVPHKYWRISPMWVCAIMQDLGFTLHARRIDTYQTGAFQARSDMVTLVFRRF